MLHCGKDVNSEPGRKLVPGKPDTVPILPVTGNLETEADIKFGKSTVLGIKLIFEPATSSNDEQVRNWSKRSVCDQWSKLR